MPPYFQTISPLEMDFYVLFIFISPVTSTSDETVYLTSYGPSSPSIPITTISTLAQGTVSSHLAQCHSLLHAEGVVNIE